jgi:hypothetical protein
MPDAKFYLYRHGRRIQLRGRSPGSTSRVIDSRPLGLRSLPEAWYALMDTCQAAALEDQLLRMRIGDYRAVPAAATQAPESAQGWLDLITHLCWILRSTMPDAAELGPVLVAHHRLGESLRVIGLQPLPRHRRCKLVPAHRRRRAPDHVA